MNEMTASRPHPIPIGADAALFDVAGIDLDARAMSRDEIHEWIPHRGQMSLLSAVVWLSEERNRCIGIKTNGESEFWVPGHFPGYPLLPGVLMIEAAAQLMCMLYNIRYNERRTGIFTRIENCSFRQSVTVGDSLYIMIEETRFSRRGFQAGTQGWVNGAMAFEAQLSGIIMPSKPTS